LSGKDPKHTEQLITAYKFTFFKVAKKLIPDYTIRKENVETINKIYHYFLGFDKGLDLSKSILLIGDYGTGKSTLFEVIHRFLTIYFPFCPNLFRISSVEEIFSEASKADFNNSVYLFNSKPNVSGSLGNKPVSLVVNEFGHTYNSKSYGTSYQDFMESFLARRYDIYQQYGKHTHLTTNYDTEALKELHSDRIIDRFKEQYNIVHLTGKSFRK